VHQGLKSIAARSARIVLVVGAEQMTTTPAAEIGRNLLKASYVREEAEIDGGFAGIFGKIAGLYFQRWGDQSDALARIAAKNHKNGVGNPFAQIRKDLGYEFCRTESEKNPRVAGPLKRTDCSLVSDGSAAIVLADVETALRLGKAVAFRASAHVQDFLPMSRRDVLKLEGCSEAWKRALTGAGIALTDLSFVETHDCFTIAELMEYEAMGLVPEGQGARAVAEGLTEKSGPLPVNPSGGLKAKGHPIGATGVSMHGRPARRHLQYGRHGGRQLREHPRADQVVAQSASYSAGTPVILAECDLPPSVNMNWLLASSAKCPPSRVSSSKVPLSMTRPPSNTRMRLALRIVASRCAITKVVRPFITSASAACTRASVSASRALVASSRIKIGGSLSNARAIERRWRSPPENSRPRSPALVSKPNS
jgi:acetyl-CoA acetyltransferase